MIMQLVVSKWALCNPFRDVLDLKDSLNKILQAGVSLDELEFHQIVAIVQAGNKVEISPCELNESYE